MDDPAERLAELQEQVVQTRTGAIEANKALITQLEALWHDLNELSPGYPDAQPLCEEVAADIARLEKLNLTLDTEWLADAKRARRQAGEV